jgi:predicted nucleotidyltransferase
VAKDLVRVSEDFTSIPIRDSSIAFVNTSAPELSPLFRSDAQAEILARLLLDPERSYSIADLARMTHTSYATTHREVQRLIRTGVVSERRVGQAAQIAADTQSRAYGPLRELLLISYGPATVIPRMLAGVDGIREAYIYGSWAARRDGEPGSQPRDIDVLVVGNPKRAALYEAAREAERALGREVNIRAVSPAAWEKASDPFLATVRERPLAALQLRTDGTDG